jgi:hypothetical protein
MAVQLNVNNFKMLMKKGTINYVIDNVKMTFTQQSAVSSMRGTNLLSCVKLENNILTGLKKADEIDFCFVSPLSNVLPYLEILRENVVDVNIENGYIELKESPHVVKISLLHPNIATHFDATRQPNIESFVSFNPTEQFANFIDKSKRVCAAHGRIFLGVKNGVLYIRAGGALNELTSEIKLNLVESDFQDIELNYNYKSFINLIGLIGPEFTVSISYAVDQELGLMKAESPDKSEVYYQMSTI